MHEIERKFLVTKPLKEIVGDNLIFGKKVEQCYLQDTGGWNIRVRRVSNLAGSMVHACTQTMKRRITNRKCIELETVITEAYFDKVRGQCGKVLVKSRFTVNHGGRMWEIDHFPQFDDLVVAEIELDDEDATFDHPDWLGEEVTDDKSYKNVRMAKRL